MHDFTPFASLTGGILIGISAALLLVANGRIAGISGIVGGLLGAPKGDAAWRLAFLGGLLAGGVVMAAVHPRVFHSSVTRSLPALLVAGILVGFGTQLGSGCTSGHGVCGIGRLSKRSIVATGIFMGAACAITFVVQHVLGGAV